MDNKSAIKTILASTLYPSSIRQSHGIFVETRLRELIKAGIVNTTVIAPVPWFPLKNPIFGLYADYAKTPHNEEINGINIFHPRYLLPPKIGTNISPFTLANCIIKKAKELQKNGYDFDLIDSHYFYPDGVAATIAGKALNKPVIITARGTDINLIPNLRIPRKLILKAANDCAAIITVCSALKDALVDLGANAEKITVLRNGVDLQKFQPEDKIAARKSFSITSNFAIASVGHLIERKGHHLVIEALNNMQETELYIAGSGEEEQNLRKLANNYGVANRVHFLGSLPQTALRTLYSAVDCLVLASSREGWANVLLESMACGTPVVASNVWGTPEVVATPVAGVLMDERSAAGVVRGVSLLRAQLPRRTAVRSYAEQFAWQPTTDGQLEIFSRIMKARIDA